MFLYLVPLNDVWHDGVMPVPSSDVVPLNDVWHDGVVSVSSSDVPLPGPGATL